MHRFVAEKLHINIDTTYVTVCTFSWCVTIRCVCRHVKNALTETIFDQTNQIWHSDKAKGLCDALSIITDRRTLSRPARTLYRIVTLKFLHLFINKSSGASA